MHQRMHNFMKSLAIVMFMALASFSARAEVVLLPAGASWNYLVTPVAADPNWAGVSFDDTSWANGPAELGYGDGDEATVIGFGGDANNKYPTAYFRKNFNVTDPTIFGSLLLTLTYDDGAVVYINGVEVYRINLADGPVLYGTFATQAADYTPIVVNVPSSALVAGNNVVAVEMHQGNGTSSDISMNLEIKGNEKPTAAISAPSNGAIFYVPASIALSATAADTDGGVAQVSYFYQGSNLIGSAVAFPYSVTWSNILEGTYPVTAIATDSTGGTGTSTAINVSVVDTNPPVVVGAIGTTNTVTVTFTKNVNPVTALNSANYTVNNGVSILGAAYGTSSNLIVLQTTIIGPNITYTLTVTNVQDNSGNKVPANSTATFQLASFIPADIGGPAIGGSYLDSGNGYDITAGGTNIFGTSDQFTFVYQQIAGDFDFKVRVQSLSAVSPWAVSGLMARETLAANSRFAASLASPNISGSYFSSRATAGGVVTNGGWFPANYPNAWVRLQRANNTFTGYGSFDGQSWTLLGSVTVALSGSLYLGYPVCSANGGQTAVVQVRDFASAVGGAVVPLKLSREPLGPSSRHTGLVISELMYHPKGRPDGRQTEFIEIYNSMSIFENMSGYRISGDVDYTFPNGTIIQPGQFLLLAKVAADVQFVYGVANVLQYGYTNGFKTNVVGMTTNITADITNSLSNGGGTIRLRNKAGAVLLDIPYGTKYPWPIEADGGGHSLVLARPSYGEGYRQAWAASESIGGSPGNFDPIASSDPARNVVINEFLAHTDPPFEDTIELYNHGNTTVDISGFWLSDDVSTNKFRIPDGTTIGPRGFKVFGQATLGFALTASGEQIILVNSNRTRVVDAVGFDGQQNGVSMGRYPDGASRFQRLSALTFGTTNAAPLGSPVVINEIMYNPISGNSDDEYVELYNRSASAVNVGDWKFNDGITFTFPPNTMIPSGGYLVLAKNASHLQGNYNNLGTSNLIGDYGGTLANGGERIALSAPDYNLITNGFGQVFTNVDFHYVVNEVTYGTGGRWGDWADGGGSSLELIDPNADATLAANWADSIETNKSSWTSFEFTGTADNALSGQGTGDRLEVMLLGVGECLVDDLEVRVGGANYIANGGFENGASGWTFQGSHDQSFIENSGFTGSKSLHILAESRGDNGGNRIRTVISPVIAGGTVTLRGKARWLRGFPEVLLRVHGGMLEAFGRLPVPTNLGTPGARNSRAVTNAGPAVYEVTHNPPLPQVGESVQVTARADDPNGLSRLVVRFRADPPGSLIASNMVDDGTGGDAVAGDGVFTATIPAQSAGTMIAFYIEAVDGTGVTNLFPANALVRTFPNDAPSHECLIRWGESQMPGSFATYHMWISSAVTTRWNNRPERLNNSGLDATFVYNNFRVVYNAKPQYGGSPWHSGSMQGPINTGSRVDYVMNCSDDELLLGQTDFIFNTVGNPSGNTSSDLSGMAEQTSYEIFKGMGLVYNYRRYVHVFINGDRRSATGGVPFIMEDSQQPNGDMVKEWFSDDSDGQLYKIEDWFEFPDSGGTDGNHANDDADLQRRNTTYNGVSNIKIAPYRFMWRKRSVSAADSANDYTNILSVIDIVSPAANPTMSPLTDAVVKQFGQVVDIEQWFRIFSVQHTVGNWDSYGYERGKNCYSYRPNFGKFNLMTWDIDFTMGVGGHATSQTLFDVNDARISALNNTPETLRAYWRSLQDVVNGPLNNSYLDPLLDARAAAFKANNIQAFDPSVVSTIKSYITGRRAYIVSQLATVAASWNLTTASFTTSSNIVTLTGTAPIDVKYIEVDGVRYAVAWTGTTAWSLRLPMSVAGVNNFTVQALDRLENVIPGTSRALTVNYTGTIEGPQTNIVFNEIMYNPLQPGAEYVELFNRSTNFTFDLSGWRINGLDYTFPDGATIGPRSFLVLTKDRIAFGNAFGGGVPVFDQFNGGLQSDGETLTLIKPGATPAQDLIVDRVRYDGALPWPTAANGTGSSLQLIDAAQDNSRVGNWFSTYSPAVYCCGSSTPAMTNDGWRFVSVSGSVGNGNGGGVFRLVVYLGTELGTALLDDISLVDGTNAAVGVNYVRNGDFEAPLIDDPPATNSWMVGTNYLNSLIVSGLTHAGNGALKLAPTSFGNSVQITATSTNNKVIYQALSPAPATASTGTLSFWFWATNSSTNLTVKVVNSSLVKVDPTNINITISQSNYVPPTLVSPAISTLSPSSTNQGATTLPPFPTLWINELQADNISGILDNASEHDPWIEIYNAGTDAVSLDGLYLSLNYTNLTNWAFPSGYSIGGGQFTTIFCDGQPGQTTPGQLHTSFRLPSGSGSIALSRLYNNQPQVLDYINYAALHGDRSYGSYPDGQPFNRQEFFYVTSGGTNDGRSAPITVLINEWMASNSGFLTDPADLNFDDWFELYNPGTNDVDIAGYYLTDALTNKFKYKIPTNSAHVIPAHGFLLVWADNETGQNTSGGVPRTDLHVNFQLAGAGEEIGMFAADGTQIDAVTFQQQTNNISEGRYPNGGPNIYSMTNPTPRLSNFVPGAGGNNPPTLTPIGPKSVFVGQTLSFTATASDPDSGQMLHYTLDGGGPPGASINFNSGSFSWTPATAGTTVIGVRVTDTGTPVLDDYENVAVSVLSLPGIATPMLNGNELALSWSALQGRTYRVEYKNDLNDDHWTQLGQDLTAATDTILSVTDDITNGPRRFYHLIVVP